MALFREEPEQAERDPAVSTGDKNVHALVLLAVLPRRGRHRLEGDVGDVGRHIGEVGAVGLGLDLPHEIVPTLVTRHER
ncbi:hypothetical protein KRM28CT15_44100 [Krasilnikovia sp. M28-CT-15]